jgi:hypothetical protein
MSTINSLSSCSTTTTTDEPTVAENDSTVDSMTSTDAVSDVVVNIVYNNDESSSNSDDSSASGDGADTNGLTYPSFSIDMKQTMLLLASLQSETAESTADFTSEQIESLTADKFDLAAKNVDKCSKAREKAKEAEFWSNVSEIAGYVGSALVMATALITCNPLLMVAGACMLTATAMNQTGATTDVINAMGGGNEVLGTIALGACIGVLSLASGGAAGLTMMTTLAPSLLVTPDNLESMGVSSEAAVWISVGVGVGCALVGAVGISRMASTAASAGQKTTALTDDAVGAASKSTTTASNTSTLSDDAMGLTDDAARSSTNSASAGDDAAATATNSVDDVANVTDDATSAAYKSTQDTTKALMNAADDSLQTVEDAATLASKIKRMARAVADGRLERVLQKVTPNAMRFTDDVARAAKLTQTLTQINRASTGVQAVLDLAVTGMQVAVAFFSKAASEYEADAELVTAQSDAASTLETMYEQQLSELSETYSNTLSRTRESISTLDSSVVSHLQASV